MLLLLLLLLLPQEFQASLNKVKNEPVAIEKCKERCSKLAQDLHAAKIKVRAALANRDNKFYSALTEKLAGADNVLANAITYFEDLLGRADKEWQFDNLNDIKKQAANDVKRVSEYMQSIKTMC